MKVGDLVKYETRNGQEVAALVLEIDVDYVRCAYAPYRREVEGWLDRSLLEVISESR